MEGITHQKNGLVRMIFCKYLNVTYMASRTADNCDGYFRTQVIKDSEVMQIPISDFTVSRNFLPEEEHGTCLCFSF